jgi:hypothetical protein
MDDVEMAAEVFYLFGNWAVIRSYDLAEQHASRPAYVLDIDAQPGIISFRR